MPPTRPSRLISRTAYHKRRTRSSPASTHTTRRPSEHQPARSSQASTPRPPAKSRISTTKRDVSQTSRRKKQAQKLALKSKLVSAALIQRIVPVTRGSVPASAARNQTSRSSRKARQNAAVLAMLKNAAAHQASAPADPAPRLR